LVKKVQKTIFLYTRKYNTKKMGFANFSLFSVPLQKKRDKTHSMYHNPVMLQECLEGLNIKPEGIYVDLTFGGGGHSKAILERLAGKGKLYAFDQDADAGEEAEKIDSPHFQFIDGNFRHFKRYLRLHNVPPVDGILADLGVSSHQFDTPARGFSIRFEGELDMRMNQQSDLTASHILATYSEEKLRNMLYMYGEVSNAKVLTNSLIRQRIKKPITTIQELKEVCLQHAPRNKQMQYLAQVFQALRIEVNDEMKALEEMLLQMPEAIKKDGRLVVLTYHSLEDRLVKNFIQKGKFEGEVEKDVYGNFYIPFEGVNRKVIIPSDEEISANSRARSAKLRVATRV
jgi:16S rRNA (cytosine1402-N4)-methyltransferase